MQYYLTINIVLVLFFLAFFFLIFQWLRQDFNLKEFFLVLLFSIGITFLFKYSFQFHFFGLEYEDSYIFNFSARQLFEKIYPISFLTDGISVGSLSNPILTVTYGGHFITYPVFISWAYHVFGYNIHIPSYVNTFIEFLIILTLSISFKKVFGFNKYWFLPGIIFSLAPAMNVFGTTQLSETFSSFIVLVSILSFFYYFQSNKLIVLLIFGICFFTAIITKRENMVLLCLFFLFSIYKSITLKKNIIFSLLPIIVSFSLLIIYFLFIQNVFLIEKTESSEISTQTFSLSNFINLFPVFIQALSKFNWFIIYLILIIASIIFISIGWQKHPQQLFLVISFLSYFIIYTLHYRSYYFVHFADVKPFEALRYLNNFFVISTLFISFFFYKLLKIPNLKGVISPILFVLFLISFVYTLLLRKEFSKMEVEDRFSSPVLVLKYLSEQKESVLITDNILIFQLLGNRNLELVDLQITEKLPCDFNNRNVYLFLSNFNKSKPFEYRYPPVFKKLQMMKKEEILKFGNDDSLYKIK